MMRAAFSSASVMDLRCIRYCPAPRDVLMHGCAAAPDILPCLDARIQRIPVHTASVNGHHIAYLDEGPGPPGISFMAGGSMR